MNGLNITLHTYEAIFVTRKGQVLNLSAQVSAINETSARRKMDAHLSPGDIKMLWEKSCKQLHLLP